MDDLSVDLIDQEIQPSGRRMPRLADAERSERRQQLVDAAWRCVARRGFPSLTVDEVCDEAGVSKGAFYTYFDQKQELLLALIQDEAAATQAVMRDLEQAHASSVDRLRRFARAMIERGESPASLQIRADMWAEMSSNPTVKRTWAAVVGERRAVLKGWIEESIAEGELAPIPANALAAIVLSLGDGLMLHAGLDPGGFRWVNVQKAIDALLQGIES